MSDYQERNDLADNGQRASAHKAIPVVYIVDDDRAFGVWLSTILEAVNIRTVVSERPSEFLEKFAGEELGCIVLDVRLPEMSGLKLHDLLIKDGVQLPVIIITAFGDVAQAVQSLKAGAVDYVQKPASAQALLDRIQSAIAESRVRQQTHAEYATIHERYTALSPREEEVLNLLLDGNSTKQVSAILGIGLTTVDYHRNNILQKMRAENVIELTQLITHYNHLRPGGV